MAGGGTKQDRAQQKALEKQKQKLVEDKTFGLKNKNKSKTVQKFIKSLQQQVTGKPPASSEKFISEQNKAKSEKQKLSQQQALLASLFRGTENIKQVVVDPNKPAYDPKQSRDDQKIDIYTDPRTQSQKDENEMSTWDLTTLENVVKQKHGADACTTDIICKHFLTALETKKYGWFWVCPNGGDKCKYRHCLPPGFVLKSDVPKEVEDDEETLEERIERQRAELPPGGEMVTAESLARWRAKKEETRLDQLKESMHKGGQVQLTGKDLFTFNPSLFMDDDSAAVDLDYDDDEDINEIIRENERSLTTGNVMPDGTQYNDEDDELDSVDISKLRI
ncbi:Zinc finger CCCH domain-containing protein 21 [Babesia sp. Xinjiang]|uniref:Zinc finger CCCH domain-containing protein 21 n=1 Tax=Babesia sp. Xinjiang TaxID=462227 RepID=UPI000A259FCD|nr:Zinc finger CCCH domain-containing protein 21 [Babesia sp. Xinjiang]XP_028871406.1 Zinc finger CCCH domain-containing protein 21 [Babesia sp. Xinjiang]ORM40847.1 Zinc finger CCCH domain-containing protein 21 [Babesia sp. Xinjiang]ORM40950.1 Zinc finger CCCH domain-containing protein 21 [Babesia sp. Xinjiang]